MKVDIIIAGAQKCGTTALHYFLCRHPKVIGSDPKELDFFNYELNFSRGTSHYHSFFKPQPLLAHWRGYRFLDASPSYVADSDPRLTARRIHEYNPQVRVISLVRDPVMRAHSAWHMYKKRFDEGNGDWWVEWVETRSGLLPTDLVRRTPDAYADFTACVRQEIGVLREGKVMECSVLAIGRYHEGIADFQEVFGDQFLVVRNEDMREDTPAALAKISAFLGLAPFGWEQFRGEKIFKGDYSETPPAEAVGLLNDFYAEDNEELFRLTGIDYR